MEGCFSRSPSDCSPRKVLSCADKFYSKWSGGVSWFLSERPVLLDAGTATQEGARWDSLASMRQRFSLDSGRLLLRTKPPLKPFNSGMMVILLLSLNAGSRC